MAKKIVIPKDNNIISFPLEEAMPENYLPYAVEVAKERALPDVRDGLKPVQRRIVYGSYMLKAFPDKPYYKSARIVGDILGKYHPHGDSSVYDAMVILAQGFTTRMPLIDGHGNWGGSQDGDSAAAMRYTEARLTPIAMEIIRDIDKDVVNMVDNYSNSEKEPEVLPAKFPNILVNGGAFGIAVGLATNIPPHNLGEVIDGTLAYIDKNEITTKELLNYIKGPDLPTGGVIIGKKSMLSAYETGEGRVTLRAKTTIEKLDNGRLAIAITEFPFRKNKAKLLQFISEMTADKKHSKALENITDIRDESDRNGIRAVIEFKKMATQDVVEKTLKYLYKKTDLQSNISFNMVALADGKPKTLGLKAMLKYYVEHQKEVITRRTKRELEIAEKRFHIVEGFIKAIGIMDEIIKTIRGSKSKKNARENLIEKFSFTDIQAEAILELMLYKLTGLEVVAFEKEYKELEKLINKLTKILKSEKELLKVIKKELIEVKETYNDNRRTDIIEDDEKAKIDIEEIIVEEDVVLTLSNEGFVKRISLKSYNRSSANIEDIEYREGDFNRFLIQCNTKDTLCLVTKEGNMYQIKVINIPEFKWKEKGVKLDEIIKTIDSSKNIIEAFSIEDFTAQKDLIFVTDSAYIKKTTLDKFNTNYTKIMALKLKKGGESLVKANLVDRTREEKFFNIKTEKGLTFNIEEPTLEAVDRNIVGYKLFDILPNDSIEQIEFCDNYEYKSFYVNISKDGLITISDLKENKSHISLFTDSSKILILFDSNGKAYYIPAFMIQNIKQKGINISEFIQDKINVLSAISTFRFEEDVSIYFVSQKGLIKRTQLNELRAEVSSTQVYKFKDKEDKLVSILIKENEEEKNILIITEKAMAIRFKSNAVNPMGKMASGVTGISLKDLDKVILALIIEKNDTGKIKIKTKSKDKGTIEINKNKSSK